MMRHKKTIKPRITSAITLALTLSATWALTGCDSDSSTSPAAAAPTNQLDTPPTNESLERPPTTKQGLPPSLLAP